MIKFFKAWLWQVLFASFTALPLAAQGQSIPVSVNLYGTIAQSSDGKVLAAAGDTLSAINATTGVIEDTFVLTEAGAYACLSASRRPLMEPS